MLNRGIKIVVARVVEMTFKSFVSVLHTLSPVNILWCTVAKYCSGLQLTLHYIIPTHSVKKFSQNGDQVMDIFRRLALSPLFVDIDLLVPLDRDVVSVSTSRSRDRLETY